MDDSNKKNDSVKKDESFNDIFSMFEKETFSDLYSLFDDEVKEEKKDTRTDEEVLDDIFKDTLSSQEDKSFVMLKKQDLINAKKLEMIRLKKEEEEHKAKLEAQRKEERLRQIKKQEEALKAETVTVNNISPETEDKKEEITAEEVVTDNTVKEETVVEEVVSENEVKEETVEEKTEEVKETAGEIKEEINEPFKEVKEETVKPEKQKKEDKKPAVLKKKKSFNVKYLVVILLVVLLGIGGFMGYRYFAGGSQKVNVDKVIAEEQKHYSNPMKEDLRREYLTNRNISDDYVGQIYFTSGLLSESIVQAKDVNDSKGKTYRFFDKEGNQIKDTNGYSGNDVYTWTNWKKMEKVNPDVGIGASSYLNENGSLDDKLLVINGISWRSSGDKMNAYSDLNFTNLEIFMDSTSYSENNEFKLLLDNEIRTYKICAVFDINLNDELCQNMVNDTQMNRDYLRQAVSSSYYRTGLQMTENDNYLLFVVRHKNDDNLRYCLLGIEKKKQTFGEQKEEAYEQNRQIKRTDG